MESSPFHIAWWMCYAIPKRKLLQTPSMPGKVPKVWSKAWCMANGIKMTKMMAERYELAGKIESHDVMYVVCVVRVIQQKNTAVYWRYWISLLEFNFISEKNATVPFLCVPLLYPLSYACFSFCHPLFTSFSAASIVSHPLYDVVIFTLDVNERRAATIDNYYLLELLLVVMCVCVCVCVALRVWKCKKIFFVSCIALDGMDYATEPLNHSQIRWKGKSNRK